jgi:hypothetical protein
MDLFLHPETIITAAGPFIPIKSRHCVSPLEARLKSGTSDLPPPGSCNDGKIAERMNVGRNLHTQAGSIGVIP